MSHPYKNKSAEKVGHARAKAICKQDGGFIEGGDGARSKEREYTMRVMNRPLAHAQDREILHGVGREALRQRANAVGPVSRQQADMAEEISRAVPRRKSGGRLPTAGAEGGLGRLQLSKIQKAKRT